MRGRIFTWRVSDIIHLLDVYKLLDYFQCLICMGIYLTVGCVFFHHIGISETWNLQLEEQMKINNEHMKRS